MPKKEKKRLMLLLWIFSGLLLVFIISTVYLFEKLINLEKEYHQEEYESSRIANSPEKLYQAYLDHREYLRQIFHEDSLNHILDLKDKRNPIMSDSLYNALMLALDYSAKDVPDSAEIAALIAKDSIQNPKTLGEKWLKSSIINSTLNPDNLSYLSDGLKNKIQGLDGNPFISFQIEYWLSPIHFKGYKLSSNKLIIYGLDTNANISLFFGDSSLMMNYQNKTFSLKEYQDYKRFDN